MFILKEVNSSVISEKRKLIAVFFVFTFDYVILCVWFFLYGNYYKVICSMYVREIIDNCTILLISAIPILVVTYMHRTNYNDIQAEKAHQ